jgi:hypothetical protein
LILLDSASAVAPVAYEPLEGEKSPDIFLDVGGGIWLEAAYLEPRLQNAEARKEAFKRYARAVLRKHPEGKNIDCELYGVKTAFGYDYIFPSEDQLRGFFRKPEIVSFFNNTSSLGLLDLHPYGATAILSFNPTTGGRVHGGTLLAEAPRVVSEHAVYRVLSAKGKHYPRTRIQHPLIVCIASERSPAVWQFSSPHVVSLREAISAAFRDQPLLSGALIVSIEDQFSTFGTRGRRARTTLYVNELALNPLCGPAHKALMSLSFTRVEYGNHWNEWENAKTPGDRERSLGGSMQYRSLTAGHYAISFPAHELVHVLGGMITAEEWERNYGMTARENLVRRAAQDGRVLLDVRLLPHDGRSHDPQMVELEFGPPRELILRVAKSAK